MNDALSRILLFSEGEKYEYDTTQTWVDLFLTQAKEHPQKTAAEDAEGCLTYSELENASDRIAGYLLANGLKKDEFVAVRMNRKKEWACGSLF